MFDAVRQPLRAAQRLGRKSVEAVQTFTTGNSVQSFAKNEKGAVAVIFALTAIAVVAMVGGSVDFGRAYSARSKMQSALDSAALAAGAAYQNDPNHNSATALEHGVRFFNASMANEPGATITTAPIDPASKIVAMTASLTVNTPFLSLIGVQNVSLQAAAEATTTEGVSGGGGSNEVELVMMLDTTGSMGLDSGNGTSKISALRTSATNFVNILIPNAGTIHAKIALVPFAPTVKVDDLTAQLITGQPLTQQVCTQLQNQCVNTTCAVFKKNGTCKTWNQSCTDVCVQTQTQYLSRCMIDRIGVNATREDAPIGLGALPASWATSLATATTCTPNQKMLPLTTDKTALLAEIAQFTANGSTAGALGTAWAWYALSPQWNGVFTGTSAPKAYGTPKLKKIAVLMTDGEYNCANAPFNSSCGDTNTGTISNRAVALCTGMKAQGIEVYTVGFKLDIQIARDTLSACATDPSHAFLADNAAALEQAFREIAFRAVPLHLQK